MKLLLHIGLPKTGSTRIQSSAIQYRDILCKEFGIYWPLGCSYEAGEGDTIGHHKLAHLIAGSDQRMAHYLLSEARKEAESNACGALLISSEGFATINPSLLSELIQSLSFSEISIFQLYSFITTLIITSILLFFLQKRLD